MYYIFDDQTFNYLEWSEKTIRDCIERLLSFHSIDYYAVDIDDLLSLWWTINDWTNNTNYNLKILKQYSRWKWKRWFKKTRNKYMTNYY